MRSLVPTLMSLKQASVSATVLGQPTHAEIGRAPTSKPKLPANRNDGHVERFGPEADLEAARQIAKKAQSRKTMRAVILAVFVMLLTIWGLL